MTEGRVGRGGRIWVEEIFGLCVGGKGKIAYMFLGSNGTEQTMTSDEADREIRKKGGVGLKIVNSRGQPLRFPDASNE